VPAFFAGNFIDWESNIPECSILFSSRCKCYPIHDSLGFLPVGRTVREYSGYNPEDFVGLSREQALQHANRVIKLSRWKASFRIKKNAIGVYLEAVGELNAALPELRLSCLETWDRDVLNRFAESRQGYDAIGG